MSAVSTHQRTLIVFVISLVALQLLVAGVFGVKPSFEAGYFTPEDTRVETADGISLSEERRRELEAILLPPPILAWSSESLDGVLPDNLASETVLLSFAAPKVEETPKDNSVEPAIVAQAVTPPKPAQPAPKAEPVPIPDISDEGIILEDGDGFKIAPVYLERLPELKSLEVDQRKKRFTAVMLPLILRANIELSERRKLIIDAAQDGNVELLMKWAELYRLKAPPKDVESLRRELLLRVDQIPPSIALAQAAIESGWGTSRFAIQGNALFGQWAWSQDQGIKPNEARVENAVVRSFANLFDSVRAYMHNLNTHHSYENFRRLRQQDSIDMRTLTGALIDYSEERDVYIDKLIAMTDVNNFTIYDNAELLPE